MGICRGFYWFFRLRSSLEPRHEGEELIWWKSSSKDEILWWDHVSHALQYIDFSSKIFNIEILAIFEMTHGGYSRNDLLKMPFDEYHELV